jgi:hypothetical protein
MAAGNSQYSYASGNYVLILTGATIFQWWRVAPFSSLSGRPDDVGPSANVVEAADATDAEGARPQHISSLLAALRVLTAKPSPPVLEKEASRSTLARTRTH